MEYFAEYDSPVGKLILDSDGVSLTGLWMNRKPPQDAVPGENLPVLQQVKVWLDAYFRGEDPEISFPLAPAGTQFQQQVWKLLLDIPFGKTRAYGELARDMAERMGKEKMSAQAVGGAVGRNPISILIPCHRVVGAQGQLTGYAGGLERKAWLLEHEKIQSIGQPALQEKTEEGK